MSTTNILATIKELQEAEAMLTEIKEQVEGLKDILKNEMTVRDVEELQVENYIIRYTSVVSSRFDTKSFKTDFGADAYAEYCKQVASKRFTISA